MRDYAFIVDHVDDLDLVVQLADQEVISAGSSRLVA